MKYELKSKIKRRRGKPVYKGFIESEKASYALFIQFLKFHNLLEDYILNLVHLNRISKLDMDEVETYVLNAIKNGEPENVIDYTLRWADCIFPKDVANTEKLWSDLNENFRSLMFKFQKEVIYV